MENKDDREFYSSLPKKALQDLCKKYGLSPYKTKPNLVDSLNSFFKVNGQSKKKKSSPSPPGSSSVSSSSQIPQSQFGTQSTHKVDDKKESSRINNSEYDLPPGQCNGPKSCIEAENHKVSNPTVSENSGLPISDIQKISPLTNKATETTGSVKIGSDNMQQSEHETMNDSASLREGAFASSSGNSSAVPYFEYHVESEEGINLYVDLNSSRADWYKSLVNEFTMGPTVQENKFRSLREELEKFRNSNELIKSPSLVITDHVHGMDTGNVNVKSSGDSIMKENGSGELDPRDGDDGTSSFTDRKTCNNVTAAIEHSKEGLNSSAPDELNSDKISSPREKENSLDSDVSESDVRLTENCPEIAIQEKDSSSHPRGNNYLTRLRAETGDHGLAMGTKDCTGTETLECFVRNGSSKKRSVQSTSDNGRKTKRQDGRSQSGCSQPEGKILRSSKRLSGELTPRRSSRLLSK